MVVIRLARGGAKKRPFYRIVVADKRKPLNGRFIEKLGYYNPFATGGESRVAIDIARAENWQKQGAQVSARVLDIINEFKLGPKPKKVKAPKAAPKAQTESENANSENEAQA